MSIVCLITLRPRDIWCDFLNLFTKYKIFLMVDDSEFDLTDYRQKYKNINFIQISNEKCKSYGYQGVCGQVCKTGLPICPISAWDKSLYYFGVEYNDYDNVWLIEDDVFFCHEDTLSKIDNEYSHDDLLSNVSDDCHGGVNASGKTNYWWWGQVKVHYPPPYYNSMACASRLSKNMMKCIRGYATQHNTLFFIEVLFPTLAMKNNLKYSNPIQLKHIYWRHRRGLGDCIDNNNLYHPIKDLKKHVFLRDS